MNRSNPELDVLVVPTCSRPVELATTLAGLAAQDHPFGLELSDRSDGHPSYDSVSSTALPGVLQAAGDIPGDATHGVKNVGSTPARLCHTLAAGSARTAYRRCSPLRPGYRGPMRVATSSSRAV